MNFQTELLYSKFLQASGISTDTRTLAIDNMFFALSGPNFNGNLFAEKAIELGALVAVVSDKRYSGDKKYIVVEDVLLALQELAAFHRSRYRHPLIALTGSNGKTTTKELINAVLKTKYITLATEGNLNNHIGVPLTLLSIHPQTEIAIIEMGASAVGEIAALCDIAKPTLGLITNIGKAHLEGFGGVEGVIRGKSEMYDFLIKNKGEVFINTNDDKLRNMVKRIENPFLLPEDGSYMPCKLVAAHPFIIYEVEGEKVETQLTGAYNFNNIAYALAIAKYFKVSISAANNAISQYSPSNNRSQIVKKGERTIILDAYNANPDSMQAALDNLATMPKPTTAILGDMQELGVDSNAEHEKILQYASKLQIDSLYTVGSKMKSAIGTIPVAGNFDSTSELMLFLQNNDIGGKSVLLKASRSTSLEKVVSRIKEL
jgi:UDP-N-acetylmuramoyl-tripeptide--D-alanyl-D-alanine ligase